MSSEDEADQFATQPPSPFDLLLHILKASETYPNRTQAFLVVQKQLSQQKTTKSTMHLLYRLPSSFQRIPSSETFYRH
jgi:hypothetical protein